MLSFTYKKNYTDIINQIFNYFNNNSTFSMYVNMLLKTNESTFSLQK